MPRRFLQFQPRCSISQYNDLYLYYKCYSLSWMKGSYLVIVIVTSIVRKKRVFAEVDVWLGCTIKSSAIVASGWTSFFAPVPNTFNWIMEAIPFFKFTDQTGSPAIVSTSTIIPCRYLELKFPFQWLYKNALFSKATLHYSSYDTVPLSREIH